MKSKVVLLCFEAEEKKLYCELIPDEETQSSTTKCIHLLSLFSFSVLQHHESLITKCCQRSFLTSQQKPSCWDKGDTPKVVQVIL